LLFSCYPHRSASSTARSTHAAARSPARSEQKASPTALRTYLYDVDIHGQLFLTETVPKNITSCFKSVPFLDDFFQRLGRNPAIEITDGRKFPASDTPSTATRASLIAAARRQLEADALRDGYRWLSPCGPELNFVRAEATPVVYKELDDEGFLHWGGSLKTRFDPSRILVDLDTGYLYHPSPSPATSVRMLPGVVEGSSPYGQYSLMSSSLVLMHFSSTLEYTHDDSEVKNDPRGADSLVAGTVEWAGKGWELGALRATNPQR